MLETTIAGSLPKPAWLAQPRMLWAPWQLTGEELAEAKRDATLLALKEQEDAGIDIVTDGEQSGSTSCTVSSNISRVSISPGGWRWAFATTATRPKCQPSSDRYGGPGAFTPSKPALLARIQSGG